MTSKYSLLKCLLIHNLSIIKSQLSQVLLPFFGKNTQGPGFNTQDRDRQTDRHPYVGEVAENITQANLVI